MTVEHQFGSERSPLGLTRYAIRVFAALARCRHASAAEIADEAGIPRQRIYDVLSDLVSRGVAVKHPGRPVRYQGIDPLQAVNQLIAANRVALMCEEERVLEFAQELREQWHAVQQEGPMVTPPGSAEPTSLDRWRRLAVTSVLATAPNPLAEQDEREWAAAVRRLVFSGGTVRCLYHPRVLMSPRHLSQARRFESMGEEARLTEAISTRWMVLDRQKCIVPLPSAETAAGVGGFVLVEQADVVARLVGDFRALWDGASPLSPSG